MKRYEHIYGSQGGLDEYELGDYCLYEEAHQVEVDRDIKAANLQLLVDKVLDVEKEWCGETALWGDVSPLFELARSLKQ